MHPTFVYVTAERFATPEWENLMRRLHDGGHISQIVLDEAHIILDVSQSKILYSLKTCTIS